MEIDKLKSFMKRRDFFRNSLVTAIGASILSPIDTFGSTIKLKKPSGEAKNIIFMVSDGMSTGTLNMASLLLQRKEGRQSNWLKLYEEGRASRALMDTASASSLVTDSAAASSSWGGGVRVPNGSLNVNPDGSYNKPILQKFKAAGKSVGCVTTVPITHATPAGFCVNSNKRSDQPGIAQIYHDLRFDVMLGGGLEFFSAEKRSDNQDLFGKYSQSGFLLAHNRNELLTLATSSLETPLLGVFCEDGLPYALDSMHNEELSQSTLGLAEMTSIAIQRLKKNKNGFVLQIEGGKVDWAAHANDTGALLYDQIAFDEAIAEVIAFAEQDKETLVVITTDHGNANPGLFYGDQANKNFDRIQQFKHTNEWILKGIDLSYTPSKLIERIEFAQGYAISKDEAASILSHFGSLDEEGLYNPSKLPYKQLAQIQQQYTAVGWASMDHSADYVELAMYGPGSEQLKPFVKNFELHRFLLESAGIYA